ncbi:hypothetical protein HMPREF9418_2250 [Neisseria macacae ATCC 33926]|uniref:Uncharacterized protein n=1 Tax=Neisseria macacae ATCC 33926 TaxID=997348 RepID=A0AA36UHL8_9NEIS|nr:hypothetical protein HMPREF9418_2250 [Neisseria macacae ATCC 33926]
MTSKRYGVAAPCPDLKSLRHIWAEAESLENGGFITVFIDPASAQTETGG